MFSTLKIQLDVILLLNRRQCRGGGGATTPIEFSEMAAEPLGGSR